MTIAGLFDLLDYAKRRNNLLLALGLASLFAWWIGSAAPGVNGQFDALRQRQASWDASVNQVTEQVHSINAWARAHDPGAIAQARAQVSKAGSELGSSGHAASFFVLSDEFDRFASAWSRVRTRPLTAGYDTWTAADFKAFALLTSGYRLRAHERRDIAEVREEFDAAIGRPDEAAPGRTGLAAVGHLTARLAALEWPVNARLAGSVAAAREIAASMDRLGFEAYAPFARMIRAEQIRMELAIGSLDVIGFSIPGVVVRLLLPVLLSIVSLDLLCALRRAARSSHSLPPTQVLTVLGGYPWLLSPDAFDAHGGLRKRSRIHASVLLAAPVGAALPLVLSGPLKWDSIVGILALGVAAAALLLSVPALAGIRGYATAEPVVADSLVKKLATQHFKASDSALGALVLACAAALPFFLVFTIVPADLQTGSEKISAAAATRQTLEKVYQQRFLDQSQVFVDWCQTGCEVWTDLWFAKEATPPGHPAFGILSDIVANPIVKRQGPASSRVKDIVTESRARFADLDPEDVRDVLEIMYRDSFSLVQEQLGILQRLITTQPLPDDAARHLPEAVRKPPVEGIAVPFVAPYRVIVEIAGFADRLQALPSDADVRALLEAFSALGVTRVEGFDRYHAEMAAFDAELGKVKLKVAGFTVPRTVARDITLIIIALLALTLAFRLQACRRFIQDSASDSEPPPDISNVPGLLFLNTAPWPRWTRYLPDGILIAGVLMTQLLVLTSAEQSTLHQALPALTLVLATAAVGWALRERRVIVRLARHG